MLVREFDFDLPVDLIAQVPAPDRSDARLLQLSRATGVMEHACIRDLPRLLRRGDLLVVNDSRVFPARLLGHRVPSGGAVECLLIARVNAETADSQAAEQVWDALVHPGQKLKPGARVEFGNGALSAEVVGRGAYGRRLVRLWTQPGGSVERIVDAIGHVPLPPYIRRADHSEDRKRYQTVFAAHRGSVAAPTAGLHFTPELVDALRAAGIEIASITLHVGFGTFQPVRVGDVESHRIEAERFEIDERAAAAIERARTGGRRVIAVGTTTTRTLESVAQANAGRIVAASGCTDLFIYPGFRFRVLDGLLTNFHLPKSSLLMLVCAFAGLQPIREAYRTAVAERYRFYSYGDAMLIV
ncbi:MAG: tRNA preQ1(34) S-adenosylmethionine ribosyltransferase-isomerase QueA [Acidimicrobiia bacterium]|nr:tRNA preQ1(34) S-adenosylmethionine ribosyltransferase-isomerase QueA [Acidimicrobiia bacterium]